jgi:hypothetical protein
MKEAEDHRTYVYDKPLAKFIKEDCGGSLHVAEAGLVYFIDTTGALCFTRTEVGSFVGRVPSWDTDTLKTIANAKHRREKGKCTSQTLTQEQHG